MVPVESRDQMIGIMWSLATCAAHGVKVRRMQVTAFCVTPVSYVKCNGS